MGDPVERRPTVLAVTIVGGLVHAEMMREWYGKCRTCHYWDGPRQGRGLKWGRCTEPEITGMDKTTHDGHCEGCWEPFDWIAHEKVVTRGKIDPVTEEIHDAVP